MPWAANGKISTAPLEGGIEISGAEYQSALAGMLAGKLVIIEGGGLAIVDPPQPEPEPEPGPPEIDDYRRAVQAHIDATAQERQYGGGHTCATYVDSTNPAWAAEALAFIAWRDRVWGYAFAELAKVQAGQRPQPSVGEFVAEVSSEIPMTWPA